MADRVDRKEFVVQLRGENLSRPWVDKMTDIKTLRRAVKELDLRQNTPNWRGRDSRIIYRETKETAMMERKAR